MASVPPPQGMSEVDYEAIEAAVTETVRGRWFLSEYARRNRLAETRQLLDAMARIEAAVTAGQPALPSADPSIRLLIQRIKEIASELGTITGDMRAAGVDQRLVEAVDSQARAVSGMMRSAAMGGRPEATKLDPPRRGADGDGSARASTVAKDVTGVGAPEPAAPVLAAMPRLPRAQPLSPVPRQSEDRPPQDRSSREGPATRQPSVADPRLAALAELDALPLARKLAFFT